MAEKGVTRVLLAITRIWLPVAIAVAGVVLIVIGGARPAWINSAWINSQGGSILTATGVVLIGIGLIVWMLNWMFRMSVESNRDREREEEAREFFDEHGRWPDE